MCYVVYDTETCSTTTVDLLEDAATVVNTQLSQQEQLGRVVALEPDGRWAVYDGLLVKMVWVETELGVPVQIKS